MVWKGVLRGTGVSRPGAFERIGEHASPADAGSADAVLAGHKLVADVSSLAGRGCRAPSSAARGAHGESLMPHQASRVESGDRGGSMEAQAGGCASRPGAFERIGEHAPPADAE